MRLAILMRFILTVGLVLEWGGSLEVEGAERGPLRIVVQPEREPGAGSGEEGIRFRVVAEGGAKWLSYQWYFNAIALPGQYSDFLWIHDRLGAYLQAGSSNLREGFPPGIWVIASDGFLSVTSQVVEVGRWYPLPSPLIPTVQMSVPWGSRPILRPIGAWGEKEPRWEWTRNGEVIPGGNQAQLEIGPVDDARVNRYRLAIAESEWDKTYVDLEISGESRIRESRAKRRVEGVDPFGIVAVEAMANGASWIGGRDGLYVMGVDGGVEKKRSGNLLRLVWDRGMESGFALWEGGKVVRLAGGAQLLAEIQVPELVDVNRILDVRILRDGIETCFLEGGGSAPAFIRCVGRNWAGGMEGDRRVAIPHPIDAGSIGAGRSLSAKLLSDGGLMVVGRGVAEEGICAPPATVWRVRVDSTGEVRWVKAMPVGTIDVGSVVEARDGLMTLCSGSRLLRVDAKGDAVVDVVLPMRFGVGVGTQGCVALQDGGSLFLAGEQLCKLDGQGRTEWWLRFQNGLVAFACDREAAEQILLFETDGAEMNVVALEEREVAQMPSVEELGSTMVQRVVAGSKVELAAVVRSDTSVTYRWFRNGIYLLDAPGPELRLNDLTRDDSGSYTLEVRNAQGSGYSRSWLIEVLNPPVVQLSVDGVEVNETFVELGQRLQLRKAFGDVTLSTCDGARWELYKDGDKLPGVDVLEWVIESVRVEDLGRYTLVARGVLETRTSDLQVRLSVKRENPPDWFQDLPQSFVIAPDQSVPLSAIATGGVDAPGRRHYQWYENRALLAFATNADLMISGNRVGGFGGAGVEYQVRVSDELGWWMSSSMSVTTPAYWISSPSRVGETDWSLNAYRVGNANVEGSIDLMEWRLLGRLEDWRWDPLQGPPPDGLRQGFPVRLPEVGVGALYVRLRPDGG